MPTLHYGTEVRLGLNEVATGQVKEAIVVHASRGGWVDITDSTGRHWSLLIVPGVPIWISGERPAESALGE